MAILVDLASRIQRVQWNGMDLQVFADEIVAGLLSKQPVEITSGLKVSDPNSGNPPVNIITNFNNDGDDVGPISITQGGTTVPTRELPEDTEPFTPANSGGGGGNAYAGEVVSGSGTSYTCSLRGPSGVAFSAGVSIPGLSGDAEMPAGTTFVVLLIGGVYLGFPSTFVGPT